MQYYNIAIPITIKNYYDGSAWGIANDAVTLCKQLNCPIHIQVTPDYAIFVDENSYTQGVADNIRTAMERWKQKENNIGN